MYCYKGIVACNTKLISFKLSSNTSLHVENRTFETWMIYPNKIILYNVSNIGFLYKLWKKIHVLSNLTSWNERSTILKLTEKEI